jgi:hypothetical protein
MVIKELAHSVMEVQDLILGGLGATGEVVAGILGDDKRFAKSLSPVILPRYD